MLTTTVSSARALTPRGLLALVALICAWCAPGFAPAAQAQGFGNFFVQNATGEFYTREDDGQVQALIRIQVDPTWHLYHTELGHPEAIAKPTVVTFSAPGVTWSEPVFPKPHLYEQSEGVFIAGHEGVVVVRAIGTLEDGAAFPLDEEIEVTVAGQTCDPNMCTDYEETLTSDGPGDDEWFEGFDEAMAVDQAAQLAALIAEEYPEYAAANGIGQGESGTEGNTREAAEGEAPESAGIESEGSELAPAGASAGGGDSGGGTGLMAFLWQAVFWGFFTLLMPCTYPMIPITISFFTKQADARGGSVLPLSLTYGAGIVSMFVLIGLLVGAPIIAFATHPVTNLVIGLAFLFFALVLFGAINLQPPQKLNQMAGQASMKGGYRGVFLMGFLLVITSFTCTAPFVGSLLGSAASGGGSFLDNAPRVVMGMATFGATIAIPFVVLSLVPGKLAAMPKAGEWMNTLKVTLGFVEVAAALKFISNADLVWGWNILSRELFLLLWAGIFAAAALYLFGIIRLKSGGGEVSPLQLSFGLGLLMLALYCVYGAQGRRMDPVMTAIIPPYSHEYVGPYAKGPDAPKSKGHEIFKDDFDGAVAAALEDEKLLLLNFTGFA
ncbi:MAG: protein-disulfide reductase DsbD family protein [Planctomycetota bacterium]|jgi:cytochrome c biogenesis protein CcdA